ncbi:hypothetical protein [Rhodoferax ferrireducens]|uniref:hypothetical protein n=1 Tax=Rhodoferax ferrireducens TaxID=192843 RepID=UPI0002E4C843|nr:hypothetical protein [Rhodoferax ferrireducens]
MHDTSQEATIGHVVARALARVEPLSKQVLDGLNCAGWVGCEYPPQVGMKPAAHRLDWAGSSPTCDELALRPM